MDGTVLFCFASSLRPIFAAPDKRVPDGILWWNALDKKVICDMLYFLCADSSLLSGCFSAI